MKQALLITVMLAGCTSLPETPSVVWIGSPAQVWELTVIQGQPVEKRARYAATLRLNPDHTVFGTLACNSISSAKLQWEGQLGKRQGSFNRMGTVPVLRQPPNAAIWMLKPSASGSGPQSKPHALGPSMETGSPLCSRTGHPRSLRL